MDPNKTLEIIMREDHCREQRVEAVDDLLAWLVEDGYIPTLTNDQFMRLILVYKVFLQLG